VDLDDLWVYEQDYGLSTAGEGSIYDDAVPRLLDLFEAHETRATLFVIGSDLSRDRVRDVLRDALERGHAVANHTQDHRPDFGQLPEEEKVVQVTAADDALRETLGASPVGFRGPGYVFDDALRDALAARGYRYDSTRYPGWTTALMNVTMRAKGATKALGSPDIDLPTWWGRGIPDRMVELPIMTVSRLHLPAHTTALYAFGRAYVAGIRPLLRAREPHGVFLLHAIDGLDAAAAPHLDMLPTLARPLEWRLKVIGDVLDAARGGGRIETTEALLRRRAR
jgi:peptidoglycan/xylan/chitin deacetylase (PgdA/CDA1 family)